jgi:hypothetical protein
MVWVVVLTVGTAMAVPGVNNGKGNGNGQGNSQSDDNGKGKDNGNKGNGKGNGKEKVTICHKGKKTITVAKPALKAHLKHGDTVGPCPGLVT